MSLILKPQNSLFYIVCLWYFKLSSLFDFFSLPRFPWFLFKERTSSLNFLLRSFIISTQLFLVFPFNSYLLESNLLSCSFGVSSTSIYLRLSIENRELLEEAHSLFFHVSCVSMLIFEHLLGFIAFPLLCLSCFRNQPSLVNVFWAIPLFGSVGSIGFCCEVFQLFHWW